MSLLDEDLVDQKSFEDHFREMLYELYERLMNGELSVDEVDKNPFAEIEMCGLIWRFKCREWDVCNGPLIVKDIGSILEDALWDGVDEEKVPILNKECAKSVINKLIDLYWDKDIYKTFNFEVRNVTGGEWISIGHPARLNDVLSWKDPNMRPNFYKMEDDIESKITPKAYKEFLDWVQPPDSLPF